MASSHVLLKSQIKFQHTENRQHIPVLYHLEPKRAMSSGSASTLGLLSSVALLPDQHPSAAPSSYFRDIPAHLLVLLRLQAFASSC